MAAPGSLGDRFEQLAGPSNKRRELYYARKVLGYTITEWLSLPWWHRRLYVEQMQQEADERDRASRGEREPSNPWEALMSEIESEAPGE